MLGETVGEIDESLSFAVENPKLLRTSKTQSISEPSKAVIKHLVFSGQDSRFNFTGILEECCGYLFIYLFLTQH